MTINCSDKKKVLGHIMKNIGTKSLLELVWRSRNTVECARKLRSVLKRRECVLDEGNMVCCMR